VVIPPDKTALQHFTIEETDLYYFIIVNCRGGRNAVRGVIMACSLSQHFLLQDAIGVSGKTAWMNPYGYLNGEDFGFLPVLAISHVWHCPSMLICIVLAAAAVAPLLCLRSSTLP